MAEDNKGQTGGTPAADSKTTGQDGKAASPDSQSPASKVIAAATKDAEGAAKKQTTEPGKDAEGKDKPAPYDQDPKWKAARAAEKKMNDILEKHGLSSADDLDDALASGLTISELLGARDANTLVEAIKQLQKDAAYLKDVKAYWKEQEELKKREDMTPEQRAEDAEKKLKEFQKDQADKKAKSDEETQLKNAIGEYSTQVEKAVESAGLSGDEAEMAKLFLGVDNPFNEVDITDRKAVRETTRSLTDKFSKFVASVKQKAIDDYAKGKSDLTPSPAKKDDGTPAPKIDTTKKVDTKGLSVDQAFGKSYDTMLEIIRAMETGNV